MANVTFILEGIQVRQMYDLNMSFWCLWCVFSLYRIKPVIIYIFYYFFGRIPTGCIDYYIQGNLETFFTKASSLTSWLHQFSHQWVLNKSRRSMTVHFSGSFYIYIPILAWRASLPTSTWNHAMPPFDHCGSVSTSWFYTIFLVLYLGHDVCVFFHVKTGCFDKTMFRYVIFIVLP